MMKTKLLLFNLLCSTALFAQLSQSFEDVTGANCGNSTCQYTDPNTSSHQLQNINGIIVTENSSANKLGYLINFISTGGTGFSDGDTFGVGGPANIMNELGVNATNGSQAFLMEDTDGNIDMEFSNTNLAGTTNPQVSLDYIAANTSWEGTDFINIRIVVTDCASATTVTLLNIDGAQIEAGAITEGAWATLTQNLSAYIGCKAQLIVGFSSDSSSEELAIDNVSFTGGVTLGNSEIDELSDLQIFPNPVSGNEITIKTTSLISKSVEIYNILGKLVKSKTLNSNTLNVANLEAGIYIMKIKQGGNIITKKLLVN